MTRIYQPHVCYHMAPDRAGIIEQCECGRYWRSVHPGNPAYAGWVHVGPVGRWWLRRQGIIP
jgi:hypothetical protein